MTSNTSSEEQPATAGKPYVAVVYFHGMGSQRRYEEGSRLVDSIDTYLTHATAANGDTGDLIRGIEPKAEPGRAGVDGPITYIAADQLEQQDGNVVSSSDLRFYEAYWAPVMNDSHTAREVAFWMASQVRRPLDTMSSPWRERARLRRSALADLHEKLRQDPDRADTMPPDDLFDALLDHYADFNRLDVKEEYKDGYFPEFRSFLSAALKSDPTRESMLALADQWHSHYRKTEKRNLGQLLTLLAALVFSFGWMVGFMVKFLASAQSGVTAFLEARDTGPVNAKKLLEFIEPSMENAAGLVVGILLFLGIGRFIKDFMGDVKAWATYEETDVQYQRREKVIRIGTDLLKHVLADPQCVRVAVVSHSLGTSVAHDTLLALKRENMAVNATDPMTGAVALKKIRHFVTMGCPVDKVNYFFESYTSNSHRYGRVVEALRGDISTAPFTQGQNPHVHWVNFWDQADIISGPLHSPVGEKKLSLQVDNVHVASLRVPSPGAAHTAYFKNAKVISEISAMILHNAHCYTKQRGGDPLEKHIGPGTNLGYVTWVIQVLCVLPWAGLLFGLLAVLGVPGMTWVTTAVFLLMLITGGLNLFLSGKRGVRDPL